MRRFPFPVLGFLSGSHKKVTVPKEDKGSQHNAGNQNSEGPRNFCAPSNT